MSTIYGKYEYEKKEISREGDNRRTWEYKIRDRDRGVEFKYLIEISKTVFEIERLLLPYPITETVESEGE